MTDFNHFYRFEDWTKPIREHFTNQNPPPSPPLPQRKKSIQFYWVYFEPVISITSEIISSSLIFSTYNRCITDIQSYHFKYESDEIIAYFSLPDATWKKATNYVESLYGIIQSQERLPSLVEITITKVLTEHWPKHKGLYGENSDINAIYLLEKIRNLKEQRQNIDFVLSATEKQLQQYYEEMTQTASPTKKRTATQADVDNFFNLKKKRKIDQ